MAYKALYRAYRPQVFNEVAGQEYIIKTLENAVRTNKIAHAYLFAGPRGTGKTTVAKIFAKAINCNEENTPCGECDVCTEISTGEHPDVIEIDAASNNGVDEVRDLIDKVKYAPISGMYKVYIIDEVHMMTTGAFNALLKTLEEPPAHAVFILATTEPHKILPTIISRCQRFDFKKVEEKDIIKRLEHVLLEENMPIDQKSMALIARLAEGGMRDALSILEQCLAYNTTVTEETINQIYGLLSVEKKIKFLKKLLSKDMRGVLLAIEEMLNASIDIKRLTFDIIDILKDTIIYKNTNDTSVLFTLTKETVNDIVPFIVVEEAFSMIDILVEASNKYKQSLNAKMYFELAMLKVCNQVKEVVKEEGTKDNLKVNNIVKEEVVVSKEIEVTQHMTEVEQLDDQVDEEQETSAVEETAEESSIITTDKEISIAFEDILNILVQADRNILNDINEKWEVIARYRYNLNTAKLATILCEGKPVAASAGAMIISFVHQPMVNDVNYFQNYYHLKQFLKEVMGQTFDFIAVKDTEWASIREKYIVLHKQKELPMPKPIVLHHIKEVKIEEEKHLNEAQQLAVTMFGEEIVELEE